VHERFLGLEEWAVAGPVDPRERLSEARISSRAMEDDPAMPAISVVNLESR